MRSRSALGLTLALAVGALAACDPGDGLGARGGSPAAASPAPGFAGLYAVSGVTTDPQSGGTRRIAGTVIVAGGAEAHDATFSLSTEIATPDGPIQADLIGTGEGRVEDGVLTGRAETQMFLAAVPGVDPGFPWIPGRLGPRVVSRFAMSRDAAGDHRIEIETRAAPGEDYGFTRTRLRAVRSAPQAVAAAEDG